jgi:hypothetical protein
VIDRCLTVPCAVCILNWTSDGVNRFSVSARASFHRSRREMLVPKEAAQTVTCTFSSAVVLYHPSNPGAKLV